MSDEVETPAQPRTSRFKEHTNTTNSIHPPPNELWKDLGIEDMIERFIEEANAPPTRKGAPKSSTPPAPSGPAASAPSEGTFGRFSRVWASVFGGVLGKRKAGHVDAEREREKAVLDERKVAAEQAYEARKLAQEMGLMPTPKIFIRPTATPRAHKCVTEPALTPRTPSLYRSPSKKDLNKQMKLSKRVSDLEHKLASARKELHTVLHKDVPPVPPLPQLLLKEHTPETSQTTKTSIETPRESSDNTQTSVTSIETTEIRIFTDSSPPLDSAASTPAPSQLIHVGKIVKKRKATNTIDDALYTPIPTDSDGDISMSASEPERSVKRAKSTASRRAKRQHSRLTKSRSRSEMRKEEVVVTVVPDGKGVPVVPKIPEGVEGKKVEVRAKGKGVGEDGYGGLEHEMF